MSHNQNLLLEALNHTAAVSVTDINGTITFVNTIFCEISGYNKEELVGKNHNLLKSQEHSVDYYIALWKTISDGQVWKGELCNRNKSGVDYWVQASIVPFKNDQDEIEGYASTQIDITNNKFNQDLTKEDQFRKDEFNLNKAQKIAKIGSFDITNSSNEIWWSNELYTLFGLKPNNFKPDRGSFYKLIHPEDQPSFEKLVESLINDKKTQFEFKAKHANGKWLHLQLLAEAKYDSNNNFDGSRGTMQDITERKEAEAALKYAYNLINRSPAVVFRWKNTEDLPVDFVSKNVLELSGYSPDQFLNQEISYDDIIHPDDLERVTSEVKRANKIDGNNMYHHEPYRLMTKNGDIKWVLDTTYIRRDNAGEVVFREGIVYDITEQRKTEESLRKSEAFLTETNKTAKVGGWVVDLNEFKTEWTQETARIYELELNKIPTSIEEGLSYYHPDDRPMMHDVLQKAVKQGEPFDVEVKFITAKGNHRWVRAISKPIIKNGVIVKLSGTLQDITDRKSIEESLKKSEALLAETSRTAKVGGWELDVKSLQIEWTEETFIIYELELDKKPNLAEGIKYYHPDDQSKIQKAVRNAIEFKEPFDLEVKFITAKANHLWVRAIGRPVIKNGNTVKVTGTFQDITDRKEAEISIQHHIQLLEQKNKELNQFAYIASHDLQEPLRTVSNYVELLDWKYEGKLDQDANLYLKYITRSVNRMRDLLHALLEYTSIGKNDKESTLVDCNDILVQIRNDLSVQLSDKNVKLKVNTLPEIKGHEHELRSLFQNLISNAIKFCKADTIPEIEVSVKKKQNEWVFAIKDNGIGIEENHKEKIFVIFQRLHNQDSFEGTGIGLARCLKIVELHGGKIWVESKPNAGSTFYFSIPN